jgi:predicted ATPase/DNA-binding CsgD family transcriptional regulator/transcriptional regulator with XRE-family HTH domain
MIATAPREDLIALPSAFAEAPDTAALGFGALLRHYRIQTGLSQEALAERANLSVRAIRALENGERQAPYQATVGALATALGLTGPERAALVAAVSRSREPRATAAPAPEAGLAPLPLAPTPFVDRTAERAMAAAVLRGDAVRLLTLTGPGGVGKTRLALEVASSLQDAFPDGVWFVDLAPVPAPEMVLPAIARALNVPEHGRQPLLATLRGYLQEPKLLLVLDNFEHVLAAAPQLTELLAACPGLKLLVTSRSRLRLRWEHALPLAPLPVPDPDTPQTAEALAGLPAVALFVERARASNPGFALTAANGPAVAALCRHLEGLPLALELAAARANVLAPAQMLTWAEQRLPVLDWDAPDLPSRQRSLRATLAWSYALLPAAEQALFRRLAVFADGWTVEAVEAVTGPRELGLDALDGLTRLCDASLVQVRPSEDEEPRFGLLETVREFALEQLQASGEQAALERQHAAYYLAIAERAAPALTGPEQGAWSVRLQREHANLRAALGWAAEHDDAEAELRLAGSLAPFWFSYGYLGEGRAWLEEALARNADRDDALRQQALEGAGLLTVYLHEYAAGAARLDEALTLARELGDGRRIGRALGALMHAAYLQGQTERWPALAAELEAARPGANLGDLNLGLHVLGTLLHEAGEQARATAYLEEALAVSRRDGDQVGVALALGCLALVAQAQDDRDRAVGLVTAAIHHARALGYPTAVNWGVYAAARVSADWAPPAVLARMLGAIDPLGPRATFVLSPCQQEWCGQLVATLQAALGREAFANCWSAGRALSLEQRIDDARTSLAARPPETGGSARLLVPGGSRPPLRPLGTKELLSVREREVLELVADGLTNGEIAERLVISTSTAKYHLTSLLNKLAAVNRTQAVAHARQQALL